MKRKPYPTYKPSGVEWLGDIPEHWKVKKTRRCLTGHKQGYYTTEDYVDEGYKLLRITDLDGNGFVSPVDCPSVEIREDAESFLLRDDDFVFARTGGAGTFGLIKEIKDKTVFASYLIRFRFDKVADSGFLRYNFLSKQFVHGIIRNIHGGVNQNVHAEDIKEQYIPLPPLPEQYTIAAFLDRETGRIDALVAKKQRLIELLKEKRTALISRAVTKGLDPAVPMKPSGVEWLGDVPEHWEVKRLKYSFQLSTTKAETAVNPVALENIESWTGRFINTETEFEGEGLVFCKDDILFGKLRPYLAKVLKAEVSGEAIGDLFVMRPQLKINPQYAAFLLRSKDFIDIIDGSTFGSKMPRVSWEFMGSVRIPLPPLPEQLAVADFLINETAKIDALIAKVETAIEKLKEYRTALISSVVTGKIDVREAE